MGALYNGVCYATTAQATDALYTTPGSVSLKCGFADCYLALSYDSGTWQVVSKYVANNIWQSGVGQLPSVSFPTCTETPYSHFGDGVVLGWGVVAAMAAAWAIRHISDQLKR